MANRYERHVLNAIASVTKATEALAARVDRHEKILDSHAQEIADLQQQVMEYRNKAILSDLNAGLTGREVAVKYELSPGRISQIKAQYQ